jgi:hypothetical protein
VEDGDEADHPAGTEIGYVPEWIVHGFSPNSCQLSVISCQLKAGTWGKGAFADHAIDLLLRSSPITDN